MTKPVRCVNGRCLSAALILSRNTDPDTGQGRYRLRCLDCGSSWWQDETAYMREAFRDGLPE